jgi:hypothetical protein
MVGSIEKLIHISKWGDHPKWRTILLSNSEIKSFKRERRPPLSEVCKIGLVWSKFAARLGASILIIFAAWSLLQCSSPSLRLIWDWFSGVSREICYGSSPSSRSCRCPFVSASPSISVRMRSTDNSSELAFDSELGSRPSSCLLVLALLDMGVRFSGVSWVVSWSSRSGSRHSCYPLASGSASAPFVLLPTVPPGMAAPGSAS